MTIDALKESKLGKIIVKLVKEPPAPGERRFSAIHSSPASNGDIHTSAPALKRAHLSYHNLSENLMYLTIACLSLSCRSDQGYGVEFRAEMASVGRNCHETGRNQSDRGWVTSVCFRDPTSANFHTRCETKETEAE